MKAKKVFIGGWVDAKLKARFLKELRGLKADGMAHSDGKITQSQFLETLLLEGVKLRKQSRQKKTRESSTNT